MSIRRLAPADMDAAARVYRAAFDHALPWLAGLHTPDQDRWFYRERMFVACTLWGPFDGETLTGVVAVEQTDGGRNEEQEPDVHNLWTRVAASQCRHAVVRPQ